MQVLVYLAGLWCAAMGARVPPEVATTALAVSYGLLFLLLLPFDRWACFLVLVAACGAEVALRIWSPIRYNTLHYATLLLLPVAYALARPRACLPKPLIFWVGMCLWFALTFFWSEKRDHWLEWITEYGGVAALALLTRQLATSSRRRREMGIVFAVTGLAVLVALLLVFGVGNGSRLGVMAGMNANGVGQLGAVGMLMLGIAAVEHRQARLQWGFYLVVFVILGIGLLLTQSRGSILAAAGAGLTFAWGQPRLLHRLLALTGCGVLFAALVLAAVRLDPAGMGNRWRSTFDKGDLAGATAGRSEIARTARYMLADNWIAGVGAGQFDVAYQRYSVRAQSTYHNNEEAAAHSAYLKIPSEGGLVAMLLLMGFYVSLWLSASRLPREGMPGQRRALAHAMVTYLLLGSLSSEGVEKGHWLLVGLLLVWFWEAGRAKIGEPLSIPSRGITP